MPASRQRAGPLERPQSHTSPGLGPPRTEARMPGLRCIFRGQGWHRVSLALEVVLLLLVALFMRSPGMFVCGLRLLLGLGRMLLALGVVILAMGIRGGAV
jgi:hypothetical protein